MPRVMSSTSPESEGAKKEVSAGIITSRRASGSREYLLLKHANGSHWSFPKGHLEGNEDKKDTALRELEEETGLARLEFVSDFNRKTSYHFTRESITVLKTVFYFFGLVPRDSQVTLSPEHIDYCWLPYEEARNRLTYQSDRKLLDWANEKLDRLE